MIPQAYIGGKARGLLHLHTAGLPVPEWRVLPFDAVADRAWRDDPTFRTALSDFLTHCGGALAVRSSAEDEDGRTSSSAGQFHTAFADSPEALFAALEAVADSARGARMAIVLMRALAPEVAGVAFSADPARATLNNFYVEAVEDHGRALVDGDATPQRFALSLSGALTSPFGVPPSGGPDPEHLTHIQDRLKAELRTGDAPSQLLARALLALEEALETAVDVEWAIADGALYFLQVRPMTALAAAPELRPTACHTSWFFDQRFLQPIAPFTRTTLIPRILRASLGSALAMRGHSPDEAQPFFYGGQAYVAHAVWRHMLDGTPRWFLSPDLRQLYPAHCACGDAVRRSAGTLGYAWDALRAVWRERREVFGNIRAWRDFREALPARIAAARAQPDITSQWHMLDALTDAFLAIHRWSILWADYAFRAQQILGAIFGHARVDAAVRDGMRLPTAEANAALARAQASGKAEDWEAVLTQYGDRSPSLDYAAPTWDELYAFADVPRTTSSLSVSSISPAPARTTKTLSVAHTVLRTSVAPIRRLLEMREEQRFHWEHLLSAQRALVMAQAERWTAQGLLHHPDEVWLLEGDEFFGALRERDRLPNPDTRSMRRHALRIDALIPKPLFLGPPEADAAQRAFRSQSPFTLQGTGASAGVARGTAVHLSNPASGIPPEAPRTCIVVVRALDPAHTFLLREAAGVVAERGGLLSHAAILAREYHVPMVTALERAADLIPDGTEVEIDGQSGLVRLLGGLAEHADSPVPK